MSKGYPKSKFDIVDQTQIQEITTTSVSTPIPIIMAVYTSDKGTEKWETLTSLSSFTNTKGSISFARHGQAQLTVVEALRYGAQVFAKRLCSADATLANFTVRVRVVVADDVSYVYIYATSAQNVTTFADACTDGYADFDQSNPYASDGNVDVPLFTVAPMGRGVSNLYIQLVPEYVNSKSSSVLRYSFVVYENTDQLESILITMNPNTIIDDVAQALNPKIRANSKQVQAKLYEDGLFTLVQTLAQTANDGDTSYDMSDLIDMDFLNGYNIRGTTQIGGIVSAAQSEDTDDQWTVYLPDDIADFVVDLQSTEGIRLTNGSYGTLTYNPMSQPDEYEKLLLGAFGADTESEQFDTVIYDLDANKLDAIFDCAWPTSVKNAVIDMVDFRGDMVFLMDLGTKYKTTTEMIQYVQTEITASKFCAIYHNYFDITDSYTKKDITVTMPLLLVSRLISHMSSGVGRPFAGIANSITFPEIIEGTVNFLPAVIPSVDQKQLLVDANINYLSYYDGLAVMETMYTNNTDYSQLSYLHNIMAVQEIIKVIRTQCPRTRYTFLDGSDLEDYIADVESLINNYSTYFKSISCEYMADELYEQNNIFYATLKVQFKNFIQEEYFKIIAIS